jgi:Carboxymuconolactone decarboxylase family
MNQRIDIEQQLPEAYQALMAVYETVENAIARVGLDQKLIELAKLRVSQINGCAFCPTCTPVTPAGWARPSGACTCSRPGGKPISTANANGLLSRSPRR